MGAFKLFSALAGLRCKTCGGPLPMRVWREARRRNHVDAPCVPCPACGTRWHVARKGWTVLAIKVAFLLVTVTLPYTGYVWLVEMRTGYRFGAEPVGLVDVAIMTWPLFFLVPVGNALMLRAVGVARCTHAP